MTDNLWDPTVENSLTFSGRHADGTVTVALQIRVRVPDEVGLRGQHLVDADGAQPDWGNEAAVLREVTDVLAAAGWSASSVEPVSAQLRVGSSSAAVPEGQFLG